MSKGKWAFSGVLLAVALAGGICLANWLVLWLLGLKSVPAGWSTWWQYFQVRELPQFAPFAHKIERAGAIGLGVPLLAWLALLIPLFRAGAPSLHGDARFADLADIKKAGLLDKTPRGILLGKWRGRPLWLNGAQHLVMVAPTRSGKTTSVAIPVLLTYEESVVVLDLKGELRRATSGRRQAMGQRIHVWAPYDEQGRTHRFNPFTLLAGSDARTRLGAIQSIAAILYPDEPGKDPFWCTQARAAFSALASFMFERWDELWRSGQPSDPNTVESFPSLERILRLSSGERGQGLQDNLRGMLAQPGCSFVSPQTRTIFSNLAGLADQTFSSVMATLQAPLQQFLNPILAAATNATDFDITTLRRRPTTLYVDIPTHKLDESGKLLNIFFCSVIGNNLTLPLGDEPGLKYQMLMLMDEFTAMGRVDVWAKRISISAGYGVRDLCIVQSRAQLRGTYGEADAQNFLTNHAAQIVFTPREQADANEYSEMLGYTTVRRENRSRTRGGGASGQTSTSHSEERRALMLAQEVKELPADEELIFYEGCKPIRAQKNWFFKDRHFKQWSAMAPVVVELVPAASLERVVAVELPEGDAMALRAPGPAARRVTEEEGPPEEHPQESEQMNLKQMAAMAALASAALSGCGQAKDYSQVRYAPNPDARERYEITVTVQGAPGPLSAAEAGAWYDIANRTCLPRKDSFTGADVVPDGDAILLDLRPSGPGVWTGTVYADGMREAPYFGTEVCTWKFASVKAHIKATGAQEETAFMPRLRAEQVLREETVVTYFNKLTYPRVPRIENYRDLGTTDRSRFGPPLTDADLFTITMSARKATP